MQIETGLLCEIGCGDGARVICLFARVIQQLGFWTQKIQANVAYCYVWRREQTRRVHYARPWTLSILSSVLDEIRAYLGSPQSQKVTFGNSC